MAQVKLTLLFEWFFVAFDFTTLVFRAHVTQFIFSQKVKFDPKPNKNQLQPKQMITFANTIIFVNVYSAISVEMRRSRFRHRHLLFRTSFNPRESRPNHRRFPQCHKDSRHPGPHGFSPGQPFLKLLGAVRGKHRPLQGSGAVPGDPHLPGPTTNRPCPGVLRFLQCRVGLVPVRVLRHPVEGLLPDPASWTPSLAKQRISLPTKNSTTRHS